MRSAAWVFEGTFDFKNFCKMKEEYKQKGTTWTMYKSVIKDV